MHLGAKSGFELFVWNWNPHIAGANASMFLPLKCHISEVLWQSYKCYILESSALRVRVNCRSNVLITGKINHVRNCNKSVSFL